MDSFCRHYEEPVGLLVPDSRVSRCSPPFCVRWYVDEPKPGFIAPKHGPPG
jgi:hypothetical protein